MNRAAMTRPRAGSGILATLSALLGLRHATVAVAVSTAGAVLTGCGGASARPPLPPPDYEEPWSPDSGTLDSGPTQATRPLTWEDAPTRSSQDLGQSPRPLARVRAPFAQRVAMWLLVTAAMLAAACTLGCQTHQCDADFVCIDTSGSMKRVAQASDCKPTTSGDTPVAGYNTQVTVTDGPDGGMEYDWSTALVTGPWLDFPGQRTYIINYPPKLRGKVPFPPMAWVSSDNPTEAGEPHANSTLASGALAEFVNVGPDQLGVLNATCARYSLLVRVEATVSPSADDAASGGSSDATSSNASDATGGVAADASTIDVADAAPARE